MALPVTDPWVSGTTQGIAAYGPYQVVDGGFDVRAGSPGLELTNGGGTYNLARRTGETFNADQFVSMVIPAALAGSGAYAGPAVRVATGANTGYHAETNGSVFYVSKVVAGVNATIAGPVSVAFAAGDSIGLGVQGTTLKVYKSLAATPTTFVQVGTDYTDTDIATGDGGVFGYGFTSGTQVVGAVTFSNLSSGPSVSGINRASPIEGLNLVISGSNFGATQGTKQLRLGGTVQPVVSWSDIQIVLGVVDVGVNLFGGTTTVEVWDSGSLVSNSLSVPGFQPQSEWKWVNIVTPNATAANRITSSADIASGDQVCVQYATPYDDATFSADPRVLAFLARVGTPGSGYGAAERQVLNSLRGNRAQWNAALNLKGWF